MLPNYVLPHRKGHVVHESQGDLSRAFGNIASLRNVTMVGHSGLTQQINPEVFRLLHQLLIEPLRKPD